jgi:hypothetical protein
MQLDRKTKTALLVIFSVLALVNTQLVNAVTSDWKLTVHVVRVPFGASYIHIHVKGPFGATRDDTIKNSQNRDMISRQDIDMKFVSLHPL